MYTQNNSQTYSQLPPSYPRSFLSEALTTYLLIEKDQKIHTSLTTNPPTDNLDKEILTHRMSSLALFCLLYPYERYLSFLRGWHYGFETLDLDLRGLFGWSRYGDAGGEALMGFYPRCRVRGWRNEDLDEGFLVDVLLGAARFGRFKVFEDLGWRVLASCPVVDVVDIVREVVEGCGCGNYTKKDDMKKNEMEKEVRGESQEKGEDESDGEEKKEAEKGKEEEKEKGKKKVEYVQIEMNVHDFEHLVSEGLLNYMNTVGMSATGTAMDRDLRRCIKKAMEWFA
ncbi:hypothetical protein ETB97_002841 [Aspergillus alliaceus]|uniref:Uncharacterized protein n=1 Tax=Petromyces alliaceus TaxID=209559 RepID=A0A8H6E4S0_PETAA|nr:hypothetical protein ETB97_002841 [Aspergillus burnettii]